MEAQWACPRKLVLKLSSCSLAVLLERRVAGYEWLEATAWRSGKGGRSHALYIANILSGIKPRSNFSYCPATSATSW